MSKKPKIAILMTIAGGGHLSVAKSLEQIFKNNYKVKIINFYQEIIHSKDEEIYNTILKYNLSFLYWPIFVKLFRIKLWLFKRIYIKSCKRYFRNNQFDLVISVIPFFNNIIYKSLNTRFIIIPTDLSNPYPAYWYSRSDLILTCTTKLFQQATKCGYEKVIMIPSLPLRKEFYLPLSANSKTSLDKPINVLVIYGKNPPNRLFKIVCELSKILDVHITVICGENKYLFSTIEQLLNKITAYGLVSNIQEIIDKNDIIVTKPGPTTIFEGISRGKYLMVENTLNVTRHEKYNIDFLVNNNYGAFFNTIGDLTNKIVNLSRNPIIMNKKSFVSPQQQLLQIISNLIKKDNK